MQSNANIEARILELLPPLVGRLPEVDLESVRNLVLHREWGIGMETLCTQLDEYEVDLSEAEIDELMSLAAELNIDISYLKT